MRSENKNLLKKKQIRENYDVYFPVLLQILQNVECSLKKTIVLSSAPTYKMRVKSFESYYRKIIRQKAFRSQNQDSLIALTDLIGIRIVCAFLEDLKTVENLIKENYSISEIEYKGSNHSFMEFGYESIHILIELPQGCIPKECPPLPNNFVCEIQIRTILQDAWAEVEHELIYKSEFTPFDMPLRRKLASINASLSLADIIFQEIRDYQNKFQGEVAKRRGTFYEKADGLVGSHSEERKTKGIERVSPYVHGTIDDMILEALHAHNSGDLDGAVSIYTKILENSAKPPSVVLSVIHKHRGMAHFARGNYDDALFDFDKSIEYDPMSFRSLYYRGIVYSVTGKDAAAVESFSKSLAINEYQSHAYYRRALSLIKLGRDSEALSDLSSAEQLGLEEDNLLTIREKLVSKFDMKV